MPEAVSKIRRRTVQRKDWQGLRDGTVESSADFVSLSRGGIHIGYVRNTFVPGDFFWKCVETAVLGPDRETVLASWTHPADRHLGAYREVDTWLRDNL